MSCDQPAAFDAAAVRPRKFGHATLQADASEELDRFIREVLGFRLSDTLPGVLSWYRCSPDHHGIAIAPGEVSGLHHYAFELSGWSNLDLFADHLSDHGVERSGDPVDMVPAAIFSPTTSIPPARWSEYFTDLQQIETDFEYQPRVWELSNQTLNRWGPPPPEDFFEYLLPLVRQGRQRDLPPHPVGVGRGSPSRRWSTRCGNSVAKVPTRSRCGSDG